MDNRLRTFLEAKGLEKWTSVLESEDVDMVTFLELTEEELAAIGITLGGRKRLIAAQKEANVPAAVPTEPAATGAVDRHAERYSSYSTEISESVNNSSKNILSTSNRGNILPSTDARSKSRVPVTGSKSDEEEEDSQASESDDDKEEDFQPSESGIEPAETGAVDRHAERYSSYNERRSEITGQAQSIAGSSISAAVHNRDRLTKEKWTAFCRHVLRRDVPYIPVICIYRS